MKKLLRQIGDSKYLVFLDLEGTQESHEMIAIGAVVVTLKKDKTLRKQSKGFKRYVLAKKRIGFYVTKLTGINESHLKAKGIPYKLALEEFKEYVGKKWDKAKFVTFGNHDIRIFNQSLLHSKDADKDIVKYIGKNFIDLSDILSEFIKDENGNPYSLLNYCKMFNLDFNGTQHDPLDDAINLGRLYDAMMKSPETLYKEYLKVLVHHSKLPEPVLVATQKLIEGEDVSATDFSNIVKEYIEAEPKK